MKSFPIKQYVASTWSTVAVLVITLCALYKTVLMRSPIGIGAAVTGVIICLVSFITSYRSIKGAREAGPVTVIATRGDEDEPLEIDAEPGSSAAVSEVEGPPSTEPADPDGGVAAEEPNYLMLVEREAEDPAAIPASTQAEDPVLCEMTDANLDGGKPPVTPRSGEDATAVSAESIDYLSDVEVRLRIRWEELWAALGNPAPPGKLDTLLNSYMGEGRHYRSAERLEWTLATLDALCDQEHLHAEIALALWFQHAVCDFRADENASQSAMVAVEAMLAAGVDRRICARVHRLVQNAHQKRTEHSPESAIMADVNFAELAASPKAFFRTERLLRQEFSHLDNERFAHERATVLRELLSRDFIFSTSIGRETYEDLARRNVSAALYALVGTEED